MTPVHLRQSGESRQAGAANDADFEARVGPDGRFEVEGGSYVTRGRRTGRLARRDRDRLGRLAAAVDLAAEYPTEGSHRSALRVGDAEVVWHGPPPTESLRALVGALAALGAG